MKTVHKILMCACIFYANYSKSQQVYFTEMNHFVFFDYKKQLGNAANLVGLSYYNIVSNDEISYEFGLTFGANYSYNLVNQQNDFDILLGVNSIGLINICYNYSIIQKHNSIQAQLQIPLMALLFNARVGFDSNNLCTCTL